MIALAFTGVVKDYRGLRPLRIANLEVAIGECVALSRLDAPAAEAFVSVATGGALPDEGHVHVMGEATSAITDGDAWLASLDRFGIVSYRAVLVDELTIAQNIAMSYSLSVDPVPDDIRGKVDVLASAVGLSPDDLGRGPAALSAAARLRAHFARALAHDPSVLLLEHPTMHVDRADARELGASIAAAARERPIAVLALTDDDELAKGMGGRRLKVKVATGAVSRRYF